MSELTDRVRESLRAMEHGNLDAVAENAHPDIVFVNPPNALEPGTRHGIEGFKTGLRNLLDAFEDLRFESKRIIDLGDRAVALGMWTGRGRGSSYAFDPQPYAFIVTMKDGLTIRYEWFTTHDEALRAAGIARA
jgi:ketosteroid isomerase-like protein